VLLPQFDFYSQMCRLIKFFLRTSYAACRAKPASSSRRCKQWWAKNSPRRRLVPSFDFQRHPKPLSLAAFSVLHQPRFSWFSKAHSHKDVLSARQPNFSKAGFHNLQRISSPVFTCDISVSPSANTLSDVLGALGLSQPIGHRMT